MKFNKWTLGLAAVGAVSMASAVRADEAQLSQLNTAISNTTISGVVDVGAQWNFGNVHNDYYDYYYGSYGRNTSKIDAFSVNQVLISLDKPLDESPWAVGYHIDLNWGQDAVMPLSTTAYYGEGEDEDYDFSQQNPLRQAYITMRTPVGNGIDWKAGLFDNILGYESNTLSLNPNYSHSIAWGVEPTSQLGLIGTYKAFDWLSVTAGLANTYFGANDYYYGDSIANKTILAAVTLTAPDSMGWAKGAALTVGMNQGFYKNAQNNYYAGLTLPTPIQALKVGFAFDLVSAINEYPPTGNSGFPNFTPTGYNNNDDSEWIIGAYASFQATDKLSVNLRGEYADGSGDSDYLYMMRGEEITLTAQYNLWANVISRVEFRWDHADEGTPNGLPGYSSDGHYNGARSDNFTLAFNLAYQF